MINIEVAANSSHLRAQ